MNIRQQTAAASEQSAKAARERLDSHVREVVEFHFNPETGSEFWLDYASRLDWDPRREIQSFDDLNRFDEFQDEWLRGGPVSRWVPRGLKDRPVFVFETGGSTGVPKSRINVEDFRTDYEMFSDTLPDEYFPRGAHWLSIGPTGPRRLRLAVEHLAQIRGGICFFIDMDPRWVIKCMKKGWTEAVQAYKEHVMDQALTLIRAHEDIRCMFTTPKLLEALCEKVSLKRVGISGVFCGGTHMTAQFHRFAREELMEGGAFIPTYGNTLMGLAGHKPFVPEDEYRITYYPPHPRAVLQIVDVDDAKKELGYGETGRVKLTTLTKEFFVPGFLERDEATRVGPIELYPWDGVQDVRPFSRFQTKVVEGVY